MLSIAILGDGAWGTTLAILLAKKGYRVTLWGNFPEYLEFLKEKRENIKFLPGIKLPKKIKFEKDIKKAVLDNQIVIIAIPSKFFRKVIRRIKGVEIKDKIFVSATKGMEEKTFKRMSEVLQEELGKVKMGVLSGPTIAKEVAKETPAIAVVSSSNRKVAKMLQDLFSTPYFRVYINNDLIGVELGGALKNVIAIAAGISDGLGFGANAKAAILCRGLQEMIRLGKKMGAKEKTFYGISGIGDLLVTCISQQSRNRTFGQRIGQGEKMKDILKSMMEDSKQKVKGVPEGVTTVKAVYRLSKIYKVEMPITKEVYLVLYKGKSPKKAVKSLMLRKKKEEFC